MNDFQDIPNASSNPELERLGFSPPVAQALAHVGEGDDARVFRVVRAAAEGCIVRGATGLTSVRVPKKQWSRQPPVVGDWIVAHPVRGDLLLRHILPRATSITRRAAGSDHRAHVLAANVDAVLLCMGLDQNFRLARLERWLSLAHEGGATPIVVLTKAGQVDEETLAARVRACRAAALGVEVVAIDVIDGIGCDALDQVLRHDHPWFHTIALLGSSGVGKSTLLNHLSGDVLLATRAISASTGKGRHTTSHRELFEIPARRLLVADTPGLREVGVWGDAHGIDTTFADLVEVGTRCRFRDCAHRGEPGCAIEAGLEAGTLDARRVDSWLALQDEQRRTASKASERERRAEARILSRRIRAAKSRR